MKYNTIDLSEAVTPLSIQRAKRLYQYYKVKNKIVKLTWVDVYNRLNKIRFDKFPFNTERHPLVYGASSGGQILTGLLFANRKSDFISITENPSIADVIIIDIYDTGATHKQWEKNYPKAEFYFIYDKREKENKDRWIEFPWD